MNKILEQLDLKNLPAAFLQEGALSSGSFPENNAWFLQADFLKQQTTNLGFDEELTLAIMEAGRTVGNNEAAVCFLWHSRHLLLHDKLIGISNEWPLPLKEPLFFVLMFLSALPDLIKSHAEMRIPVNITEDTLSDLPLWIRHHRTKTGQFGLPVPSWLANHFCTKIFKLGRLQFEFNRLPDDIPTLRNLKKGTPILGVHIPATGPLETEASMDSFRQALYFFPTFFPTYAFSAFTCRSWLLDPILEQILPQTSNLVRFQKLWHLHPVAGATHHQTFERVFGDRHLPLEQVPRNTSLQKAVYAHLEKGGKVCEGGGIIFADEIDIRT